MDENPNRDVTITMSADTLHEFTPESNSMTLGERAASTAQTTLVFGALAAAYTGACFGWAKAKDWLEERQLRRDRTRYTESLPRSK